MLTDKRLAIAGLLMALLAGFFLAGSRVPALNEKALMGGDMQLDALGFETVIQVQPDDPVLLKAIYTTVNWAETNRKGMTFGVLFAAVLMIILTLFQGRQFKSGWANSLLGMAIGAPLGVCVNCAAPIAKGLHASGARVETMLATMTSSPTLNIIVLTMLFSLFPLYLIAIKLALTVGFILIGIPLLVRLLGVTNASLQVDPQSAEACPIPPNLGIAPTSWGHAGVWVGRSFLSNLWFIIRKAVPLMILAGFLGSLIITVAPWDIMTELVPTEGGRAMVLLSMGVVAVLGVSLPVPIAFDVIVSAILLAAGVPIKYVMVLLFTLGIFSIYAFFIMWSAMPKRIVFAVPVVLAFMGVAGGVAAHEYFKFDFNRQLAMFTEFGRSSTEVPTVSSMGRLDETEAEPALVARLQSAAQVPQRTSLASAEGITVRRVDFQPQQATAASGFKRAEGEAWGLDHPYTYSVLSQTTITRFRGIATGDVHNDGWVDVLLTSDEGVYLYANQQGKKFVPQELDVPELQNLFVVSAALVDLDNDGWLDIYVSTYRDGNHVIYNQGGGFERTSHRPMPNLPGAVAAAATAFGDVDRDGDLDLVVANWSLGVMTQSFAAMSSSRDAYIENVAGEFRPRPLPGVVGEALTAILSDIDADGDLDLVIGNDLGPPDNYYLGDGTGEFRLLTREDGIIPHSSSSTMSITTADVDNDLIPEIYLAQISGRTGDPDVEIRSAGRDLCEEIRTARHKEKCEFNQELHADIVLARNTRSISRCLSLDDDFRDDCIGSLLLQRAQQTSDSQLCKYFPEKWERFAFVCGHRFEELATPDPEEMKRSIRQIGGRNVLLARSGDGAFADRAEEMGVHVGGWSWNAKFGDLDNDGWQDLFIVNGPAFLATRESNLFYKNENGEKFVDRTNDYGLSSFLATSSYSYIDIENDGDLDLIVFPAAGPVTIYRNDVAKGNAIAFEIRDHVGNHFGIGSKIMIHYGRDESLHQMREIQAGGGFVSYDAPIAHFGLGEVENVDRVEILWSTGERTEMEGRFSAGGRYIVTREDGGAVQHARPVQAEAPQAAEPRG
jgi:uncharacterized membrane protein YraQ (UPF0718 family)